MSFLDNYEPVSARLERFWTQHPDGRVITDIVLDDGTRCVIRAAIWRHAADPDPAATGYANEVAASRGVNATSMLENCETSAIGRALANLGFAPSNVRPSREEMAKTVTVDTGGFPSVEAWKARLAELRDQVATANLAEWVKDQAFPWPWRSDVCDAIAAKLQEPFGDEQ